MERPPARSDVAVSSVVGTVLMLGITLAVFAGFSLVVIDRVTDDSAAGARTTLDAELQEGRLLLRHRGGEPLATSAGRLLLTVEGQAVERPLSDLGPQLADGQTWHIGESLCLAGPRPPCLYEEGQVEDVRIAYSGELVFMGLAGDATPPEVVTYVASAAPTAGQVDALDAAKSSTDSGAEATLTEAPTAVPPGTGGPTKFSGSPGTGGGAQSPANAAASDDVAAQMDTSGDFIEVSGIDLPDPANAITAVTIGYEGRKESSGGTSPTTRLDYKLGSGTYSTGTSITEGQVGTDVDRTRTLCATQAACTAASLTLANVEAMTVRVFHVTDTNRNPLIDHVFVTVTFTTAAGTTYSMDVQLAFANVPTAASHVLELDYRATGDTFLLQVWNGAAFVTRGTLDAATATEASYALTPAEYNAGAPRLRLVDATPTGTTEGRLFFDYVRVVGTP